MDKYARLMQKLEVVNVEFFKVGYSALKWFVLIYIPHSFPPLFFSDVFSSEFIFLIHYIFAGNMPVV